MGGLSQCTLKNILNPFRALFSSIFAVVVLVLMYFSTLVSCSVLFVYRGIIFGIAKIKFPKCDIVRNTDAAFAISETYSSPHNYVTFQGTLEGNVSFQNMKNEWTEIIINKTCPKTNKLLFPELQEHIHEFAGYSFRVRDKEFDIKNHFFHHREEQDGNRIVDRIKLIKIRKEFQARLLKKKMSIWEMLIVNNYRHNNLLEDPECTIFIFKYHHILGDGGALISLLWEHLEGGGKGKSVVEKKTETKIDWKAPLRRIRLYGLLTHKLFHYLFLLTYKPRRVYDTHPFHLAKWKLPVKYELWIPEPINKNCFREIRSHYHVSVMTVIVNVITGGMRRMMEAKKLNLPRKVRIAFPVAGKNHPGGLRNNARMVELRIQFADPDCKTRLLSTHKHIKEAMDGPLPYFQKILLPYVTTFTGGMKKIVSQDFISSAVIPCMPVPPGEIKLFGRTLLKLDSVLSTTMSTSGFFVSILGVGDNFYYTIQVASILLNHPDEVRDMEKYMLEELEYFKKSCV